MCSRFSELRFWTLGFRFLGFNVFCKSFFLKGSFEESFEGLAAFRWVRLRES